MTETTRVSKYEANMPPQLSQRLVSYALETLDLVQAHLPEAIANGDSTAVVFYAQLMINHTTCGHPIGDHVIADILYALYDAAVGNSAENITLDARVKAAQAMTGILTKLKKKSDARETLKLRFDWRCVWKRLEETLQRGPGSSLVNLCGKGFFRVYRMSIYSLAQRVRNYYHDTATQEILEELLPQYCPFSNRFFEVQMLLCTLLPTNNIKDVEKWFPKILESLSWVYNCPSSLSCLSELFARAAKDTCYRFDASTMDTTVVLDWERLVREMANSVVNLMQLNLSGSSKFSAGQTRKWPHSCDSFYDENKIPFNISKLFVYTFDVRGSTCSVMQVVFEFLASIKNFVHPTNEGKWTSIISGFIQHVPRCYAKRIGDMKRKDRGFEVSKELVDAFYPILLNGIYAKSRSMRSASHKALRYLGSFFPQKILISLINEHFLPALEYGRESHAHRMLSTLECLPEISPIMLNRDIFPQINEYLERLMWSTLPGIDANDLMKTASTLSFYAAISYFIPIISAKSTNGIVEERDDEEYQKVTLIFKDWCLAVTESILDFCIKLDKFEKGNHLDKLTRRSLAVFVKAFFLNMSEEIHNACLDKVLSFVSTFQDSRARKYVGVICHAISLSRPGGVLSYFVKFALDLSVDSNSSESALELGIYYLSQVVRDSGISLVNHVESIKNIIQVAHSKESRSIRKAARKLLRNSLRSLVSVYPQEFKIYPSTTDLNSWKHWKYWGRCMDLLSDADDLQISWHFPEEVELSAAQSILDNEIDESVIESLVNDFEKPVESLIRAMLRIIAAIEGCCSVLGNSNQSEPSAMETSLTPLRKPKYSHVEYHVLKRKGEALRMWLTEIAILISRRIFDSKDKSSESSVDLKKVFCKFALSTLCGSSQSLAFKGTTSSFNKFILNSLRDYNGKYKYPVRSLLVERAKNFNDFRLEYGMASLTFSESLHSIFTKLLSLSVDVDPSVQESACSSVGSFLRMFNHVSNDALRFVVSKLNSKSSSDHEMKGALALLSDHSYLFVLPSFDSFNQVALSLCRCDHIKDDAIQVAYSNFFLQLLDDIHPYPFKTLMVYSNVISELAILIRSQESGSVHWRFGVMAIALYYLLLRRTIAVDTPTVQIICDMIFSQLIHCRKVATFMLSFIHNSQPHHSVSNTLQAAQLESLLRKASFDKPENFSSEVKFFDNFHGWNLLPYREQRNVLSKSSSNNPEIEKVELRFEALFESLVDNRPTLDDHGAVKKGDNVVGAGAAIVNVLNYSHIYSDSRFSLESKSFQPLHVEFLYNLFSSSDSFVQKAISFLKTFQLKDSDFHQVSAYCEVYCAVIKSITEVHTRSQSSALDLVSVWLEVVDKSSLQNFDDCLTAIRFIVVNHDATSLEWFTNVLLDEGFNSPELRTSTPSILYRRLKLVQPLLIELAWRSGSFNRSILNTLFECKDILLMSSYQQVRQEAARILMLLLRNNLRVDHAFVTYSSSSVLKTFLQEHIINPLCSSEISIESSLMETVLFLFNFSLQYIDIECYAEFLISMLIPIVTASKNVNVECAALAKNCLQLLSTATLPSRYLETIVNELCKVVQISSWVVKAELLKFLSVWTFQKHLLIEKSLFQKLITSVIDCLNDERVEVRDASMLSLSRMLSCAGTKLSMLKLQKRFFRAARLKGKEKSLERSGGIIGLCAMVYSEAWDVPDWMPSTLAFLADMSHDSSNISITIRKVLSEFKKSRQDSWHELQTRFSEEELSAINSVNTAPSYFA